jgi:hypothetical protein
MRCFGMMIDKIYVRIERTAFLVNISVAGCRRPPKVVKRVCSTAGRSASNPKSNRRRTNRVMKEEKIQM